LHGRHFTVYNDCNSLRATRIMVDLTPSVGVQVGEIQLEKSFDVVQ